MFIFEILQYIYDRLFVGSENSDITICALNKVWQLHKLYLGQSPYFAAMFNGNFLETNASSVEIDIPDKNITSESKL